MKGCLITFEGIEAAGKTTQARLLVHRLQRGGVPVLLVREPGGTPLGERLRRLLKSARFPLAPEAEALLFLSARAQLAQQVIIPALERGQWVVCDRWADSTLAYQGYGRGLPLDALRAGNQMATAGLLPALTVLLDIPPEESVRRRYPSAHDRFETAGPDFLRRVREGYLALAREEPGRWLVVDATLPRQAVARTVWERVLPLLASPNPRARGEAPVGAAQSLRQAHPQRTVNTSGQEDRDEDSPTDRPHGEVECPPLSLGAERLRGRKAPGRPHYPHR
ncbi:Thymidylate kinase [bacterium HR23]|nr:Thymidylate kinase [bacterium HR23]